MNLRNNLKSMKMTKGELVHDYFSRVKENIEAINDKIQKSWTYQP